VIVNTFTGKQIDFTKSLDGQIDIRDITISLSRIARYCGHTLKFYSVAQHSVIVAKKVYELTEGDAKKAMAGLLHEAPEAYGMSDIHGTFKRALGEFAHLVIEDHEDRIFKELGFPEFMPEIVDYVDTMVLVDEMNQLLTTAPVSIDFKDNKKYEGCKGYGIRIDPWVSEVACSEFRMYYAFLNNQINGD
jgi:hypothetical protein